MNEQADYILKIDRQQSIRSEKSIFCAQDASHGRMQITKDGMALICGAKNCSMVMMPHLIEEDSAGV